VSVSRKLREGDVVGPGIVVLDVPGQSPGHIAYWREVDRLLVAGDASASATGWSSETRHRKLAAAVAQLRRD
jgi:glyoxylase-like metal-dependent hydrolase (beta-lactamase superfamily II)